MERLRLESLISKATLQKFQDAFSDFTGMAALITDDNGTPLTVGSNFTRFCMELTRCSEKGCRNCEECDRKGAILTMESGKPAVYSCHAGLTDYAAPITVNGQFIGSFIGGQVRTGPIDEDFFREKAKEYDIDPDDYVNAAWETNMVDVATINRAAAFLSRLAQVFSSLAFERFIIENERVSIDEIATAQAVYFNSFALELKKRLNEIEVFFSNSITAEVSEKVAENMDRLLSKTIEMASEVNRKVDYVRAVHGTFELHESIYDVRRVVDNRIVEYTARAKEKGDIISLTLEDEVPLFMAGDADRIGQMISILIDNSITYTENGGIRVHVSTEKRGYATILNIEVADEGGGIEEYYVNKMNKYFEDCADVDFENSEYEGLGFALLGYTVAAMSGSVKVESKVGRGSVFSLKVPQLAVEGGV